MLRVGISLNFINTPDQKTQRSLVYQEPVVTAWVSETNSISDDDS